MPAEAVGTLLALAQAAAASWDRAEFSEQTNTTRSVCRTGTGLDTPVSGAGCPASISSVIAGSSSTNCT